MSGDKVFLVGPCIGELYWEFNRFAPFIFYKKKKEFKDYKLIVLTRKDRFDIYTNYADDLIPLEIDGDGFKYKSDCFKLINFPQQDYQKIIYDFKEKFKNYKIVSHIYPNISNPQYRMKNQFNKNKMLFEYFIRDKNIEIINKWLLQNKKTIIIAPRFRKGFPRNWKYWQEFYNLIFEDSNLMSKFNFVICGKQGDYKPDNLNRFYDINNLEINDNVSLFGLTTALIKKSILTIGSQSAIPNISLFYGTEVLEWGNEKTAHTIHYNPKKTKITFFEDFKYSIDPKIIYNEMKKIIGK